MKRSLTLGIAAGALIFGLIQPDLVAKFPHPPIAQADSNQKVQQELGTFAKLAKDLKPAVVNINVEKVVESRDLSDFFPFALPGLEQPPSQFKQRAKGQGSGVIISSDGYIVTNHHVVEGVKGARVTLADGNELEAKVVGTDPKTDLALLKVNSPQALPTAQMGDSERIQVGDWVMAIGNPLGLEATVTVGVLSGKGRVIGASLYDDFLQTDASINPGNSGGPLFNTDGEIVGINTAILQNAQGIGFSIPVNMVKDVVAQLKTQGRVVRGFLGVGVQPLNPTLKQALKIPDPVRGALISSLVDGGSAAQAGLKVQDVVVSLNGRPIRSDRELLSGIARCPVGSSAQLEIWRDGRLSQIKVPVAQRPEERVSKTQAPSAPEQHQLGCSIRDLTPELAHQLAASRAGGVVVVEVIRNSPAARAGLQRGDIIRKLNTSEIRSSQEFLQVLKSQQGDSFALLIERQGTTTFLTVEG